MSRLHLLALLAALAVSHWVLPAQAIPVLWTLEDVEFEDGGTAAGSFVYDADTNAYSAIAITTTAGAFFGGASYGGLLEGSDLDAALTQGAPVSLGGQPLLQLIYLLPLTNAGGPVALFDPFAPPGPSVELQCLNSACTSASYLRSVVSGGVAGVPVGVIPVPPALLLFGSALAGLAWLRRLV